MVGNWPASVGLGPDEENDLRPLGATRCQWVDSIGGTFNSLEREKPGRVYCLPECNIYDGIDVNVAAPLDVDAGMQIVDRREAGRRG